MITLEKEGKGFRLISSLKGRQTSTSKRFTSKPAAWKNLKSVMGEFNSKSVEIVDNALNEPVNYKVTRTAGKLIFKPYIKSGRK